MAEKKNILIVDDSRLIRMIVKEMLKDEYNILEAGDGLAAIQTIGNYGNLLSIILLDLVMPHAGGYQVLEFMNRNHLIGQVPVIMITAEESEESIAKAFDMGTDEVILKPFNRNITKKRIQNIIQMYERKNYLQGIVFQQTQALEEQSVKIGKNNDLMIDMLSTVIEYRSLESGQHIRRIRGFTEIMLEAINAVMPNTGISEDKIAKITAASAMHDIGKIAIPDSVLLKPGRLTEEEFRIMKTHTTKGGEILGHLQGIDDLEYLKYCNEICLCHHERWDGGGYPDGIAGDDIPLEVQAVSIADVFDALTHKRIYKDAYSLEAAHMMIVGGECGAFSPLILECFNRSFIDMETLFRAYPDKIF